MSHDDVLAVLADFAGPLGPLQSPEERDARKQQWMDTVEMSAVNRLLAVLVRSRQPPELERLDKDHVEFELAELLIGVGRRDEDAALARVAPLLDLAQARPVLIDVIGGLRSQASLSLLARVMREPDLSEDETVRLACALGEIGGGRARELLTVLQERFADPPAPWPRRSTSRCRRSSGHPAEPTTSPFFAESPGARAEHRLESNICSK